MNIQYEDEEMQFLISQDRNSINSKPEQRRVSEPESATSPINQTLSYCQTPEDLPKQIVHKVIYGDTLQGLSLQYSVPISKIKQRNHIDSDYIYHLKEIIIPNPETIPISKEKTEEMMVQEFVAHMNYSEKDRKVAKYYLLETNWDMEAAMKEYREDLEWEKKNKQMIKTEPLVPGRSQGNQIRRFYEMQELNLKKYN